METSPENKETGTEEANKSNPITDSKDPNTNDTNDKINKDNDNDNSNNKNDKSKNNNNTAEYRLGGRPPLKTIVSLSIGPLMNQITGALYGFITTIWVSRSLGAVGISAVATEYCFECIGRAFGFFLQTAASTQLSFLYGQNLQDLEGPQVMCDLLRVSILCAILVPSILIPVHNPICKWYGASPETTKEGFDYLLPLVAGAFFTCFNLTCQGFLQAEGRTMLLGIINVISLGVSMLVLVPLFLFVFKMGIRGCSIATVIADAVPGIIICICYFCGVFGLKPKLNLLFKKPSIRTWKALNVGFSQLVSNLAINLPGIAIRKLIGLSTGTVDYDFAMAAFNVFCRTNQITNCVVAAVSSGYTPSASFAFAAKNNVRFLWLTIDAFLIAFIWSAIITTITLIIPKEISLIFSSGEDFLRYSSRMLRIANALGYVMFMRINAQAILQALQKGGRATILSFVTNIIAQVGFAYLLYETDKHNVYRLMWLYPMTFAFGFLFGLVLIIGPLYGLYKESKESTKAVNIDRENDKDDINQVILDDYQNDDEL